MRVKHLQDISKQSWEKKEARYEPGASFHTLMQEFTNVRGRPCSPLFLHF